MSRLYIIRHAQASFGKEDYDELSPLGFRQSEALGDHLSRTGIIFDSIYLGEHRRHAQTFEAYQDLLTDNDHKIPVRKTAVFNEFDYEMVLLTIIPVLIKENPAFENDVNMMLGDNRIFQSVFKTCLFRWIECPDEFPGLESWSSFADRVTNGLHATIKPAGPGKNLAVITSGGVISALMQAALNLSDHDTLGLSWQIFNTSITRFNYSKNRLILSGFNDIGFLNVLEDKCLITYR